MPESLDEYRAEADRFLAELGEEQYLHYAGLKDRLELEPDVIIDYDGETFGLAANNGQMLEECARKARAAQQLRTLAMTLAQRSEPKPEAARTSPLAPILDRLGLRA